MYIFKLKLSEKARCYCMYVFLEINLDERVAFDVHILGSPLVDGKYIFG